MQKNQRKTSPNRWNFALYKKSGAGNRTTTMSAHWVHCDVLVRNSAFLIFAVSVVWFSHSRPYNTHPFNGPLSGTTWVSRYQKCKTNLDFTEARDSEWQRHPLGHMQVCTSLQTDNHASTPPLSFLQARCPSCRPTNSVKALKAQLSLQDVLNC